MVRTHSSAVEHATFNGGVDGSNPSESTTRSERMSGYISTLKKLPPDLARELVRAKEGMLRADYEALKMEEAAALRERDRLEVHVRILTDAKEWASSLANLTLSKPNGSSLHRLCDAATDGLVATKCSIGDWVTSECRVFIVQHDWSAALGAIDTSAEWKLPFPYCAFEFVVSGRRVVCMARQVEADVSMMTFLETKTGWCEFRGDDMIGIIQSNIRAACISLDASVAEATPIRAPHALNSARQRKHLCPVYDHHVLSIAKRTRAQPLLATGTDRRVRLHFRRGHWRHYETHKTWINWMLVGDPDLGFINKHYAL